MQCHQRGPGFLADGETVAQMVAMIMADDHHVGPGDILRPQGRHGVAASKKDR